MACYGYKLIVRLTDLAARGKLPQQKLAFELQLDDSMLAPCGRLPHSLIVNYQRRSPRTTATEIKFNCPTATKARVTRLVGYLDPDQRCTSRVTWLAAWLLQA
jgi:hypothetical protein